MFCRAFQKRKMRMIRFGLMPFSSFRCSNSQVVHSIRDAMIGRTMVTLDLLGTDCFRACQISIFPPLLMFQKFQRTRIIRWHYAKLPDLAKASIAAIDEILQRENIFRRTSTKRFSVGLSFSGEHREFIDRLARALAKKLGKNHVLYDKY